MYRSQFLFVCFTLLTVSCFSQIRFSKLYGFSPPYADASFSSAIDVPSEGYIFPFASWNYQNGEQRLVVQKINYKGNTLWEKIYAKQGVQYVPVNMIKNDEGNYIIAGYYYKLTDTTMYFYLLKVNSNGDSLWSKKYPPITKARAVNSTMVKQTSDKGYILCGERQPYDTFGNPLVADIYIVKTDSLGNMQWNKQFGGSGHDVATSVIETANKDFLIGGYSSSYGANNLDIYLLKIDSTGKFLWDKTYDYGYDEASSGMIRLKDGNYLLAAESTNNNSTPISGKGVLLKVAPNGALIWKNKYSGPEITSFNKVIELPNGDIVATGGNNNTPKYNQSGWLMKTNANGDSLWARIYDYIPEYPSIFYGIIVTSDNGFILTGAAQDTIVSKSQQAWVLKVDSMGCDVANCQYVGIKEQQLLSGSINVFPNPSNGSFTVKGEAIIKSCIVLDVLGNTVYSEENMQDVSTSISLHHLNYGIYFLKTMNVNDKVQVQKIIVKH